jgi:hypothetical protein
MINKILRIYSALFRYGGLVMAIMSVIVSGWMGAQIFRDGYILVGGVRSHDDTQAIATAICTPLIGVVVGLSLFFLVPKVQAPKSRS